MLDLAELRRRLADSAPHSPRLARQLEGVDLASLQSSAELARIPILRKSDLSALQREDPPFAGIAKSAGAFKRLFLSPGPIFEGEAHGEDPYGAKSAFAAAGFVAGDVVLNCFAYHLTPGGFIMESGAHALGCAVIPAGPGTAEQTLQAIAHLRPSGYVGPPDYLKILLDKAQATRDVSSIRKALVSGGALPASLRAEMEQRGVRTRQAFATAELGVVAYETDGADGARSAGPEGQRGRAGGDRPARLGRPVAGGRRRRNRRDGAARQRSRCCASPPATSPLSLTRTAFAAGWAAPIRRPRSRACSFPRRKSSRSAGAIPNCEG